MERKTLQQMLQQGEDFLGTLSLWYAQQSWPEALWRHLACDCAERALHAQVETITGDFSDSFAALEATRGWLKGEVDEASWKQAAQRARDAIQERTQERQGVEAAHAAADASDAYRYTLRAIAWSLAAQGEEGDPARQEEERWQAARLLELWELFGQEEHPPS